MMHRSILIAGLVLVLLLPGLQVAKAESTAWGLYTTTLGGMPLYIAAFNAKQPSSFNQGNCEIAQKLFAGQTKLNVKWWCQPL